MLAKITVGEGMLFGSYPLSEKKNLRFEVIPKENNKHTMKITSSRLSMCQELR
jgi:hypothetical protein